MLQDHAVSLICLVSISRPIFFLTFSTTIHDIPFDSWLSYLFFFFRYCNIHSFRNVVKFIFHVIVIKVENPYSNRGWPLFDFFLLLWKYVLNSLADSNREEFLWIYFDMKYRICFALYYYLDIGDFNARIFAWKRKKYREFISILFQFVWYFYEFPNSSGWVFCCLIVEGQVWQDKRIKKGFLK